MEPVPASGLLNLLSNSQISQIQSYPVEAQCTFFNSPKQIFNTNTSSSSILQHSPPTTLQIRGQFLVHVNPQQKSILSGFRFDYEIKFEVIEKLEKCDSKKSKEKDYVVLSFSFSNPATQKISFVSENSPQFENFIRILEKKYIVQLNFHSKFQPIRKVGKGVTANVYKAMRLRDEKSVAIKSFKKQIYFQSENGNGKKAFQKQFKVLTELQHKNICKFQGVYESDNSIYLVMEFLAASLLVYLQKVGFPNEKKTKKILQEILKGINHMHKKGLMHRDLKLENIMIRAENKSKIQTVIVDLGLAEYMNNENFLYTRCGTPGYVAPQVLKIKSSEEKKYTSACDLFSIGIIFHILLFKKSLFEGKDVKEVIKKNSDCEIDFEAKYLQTVSQEARDLLFKMLEKDPKERITAEEALKHHYFQELQRKEDENYGQTTSKIQVTV